MKVRFLKSTRGSLNGVRIIEFLQGQEYEIPESLAKDFIAIGCAEIETPEKIQEFKTPEIRKKRGRPCKYMEHPPLKSQKNIEE